MKFACRIALIVGVSLTASPISAQEKEKSDTMQTSGETNLEKVLETVTEDVDDSQLMEMLSRLQENPLELNVASAEDLQQLPGVSALLAFRIVSSRKTKTFESIDDLLQIEGMTRELFLRIRPFVKVKSSDESKSTFSLGALSFRSRISEDLQRRRGFRDGTYRGSPQKISHRLILRSTNLSDGSTASPRAKYHQHDSWVELGLVTEKDAGEASYADHLAGYVSANLGIASTKIVLGDYVIEAGEGLVFWRSVGFSKGSESISAAQKNGSGVRPYISTDENSFFRGGAVEVYLSKSKLAAFYSRRSRAASVNADGEITSFGTSGLYRTENEMKSKNASRERLVGALASMEPMDGLRIGLSGYASSFGHPLAVSTLMDEPVQSTSVLGLQAYYTGSTFGLFAEAARDHRQIGAVVGGVLFKPSRKVEVAAVARSYPRNFTSLHGFGFGESAGLVRNESGVYLATKVHVFPGLQMAAYYDQFSFPWRTASINLPSNGNDALVFLESRLTSKLSLQFQYKRKNKAVTEVDQDVDGTARSAIGLRRQTNYRATVELNSSITWRWRSRVEWVIVTHDLGGLRERGFLAFQDVRVIPLPKLLVNARLVAFQTDSFDSKVYQYESDLPGAASNPGLFGKGLRWYAVARYEVSPSLDLWVRYSQSLKEGVKVISSGADEILGGLDNKISLQLDVRI